MTDDVGDGRASQQPEGLIGSDIADHLLKKLASNTSWPDHYIAVTGRVGGQPNVRYEDGDWQLATVTPGGVMARTLDREDVRDLFQSGPRLRLRRQAETEVWAQAEREGFDAE